MTSRWEGRLSSLRRIAFDSNALIYLLEGREPYTTYVARAIEMMERGEVVGLVSTVVEMELLVKPLRDRDTGAYDRVEMFLRQRPNLTVRAVDRAVARRAADVRARTRLSPLDAIVVATALEERCDAIIGNDSLIASRLTGIPYLYMDDYL
ncbi:MAG: type II toxin-antitoxin system VapC family toxin [Chloroflexi bacterium]|nr:type II toxin-antitoxin system VapC family toxin [Chloroflexota bacterium]